MTETENSQKLFYLTDAYMCGEPCLSAQDKYSGDDAVVIVLAIGTPDIVEKIEQLTAELFTLKQQVFSQARPSELPRPPLKFAAGSDTSKEAARDSAPNMATLREEVYSNILNSGLEGRTCDEVQAALANRHGDKHQSLSPRFVELHEALLITKTGRRRKTRSNRNADVYVASCLLPKPKSGQLGLFE